METYSSFSNNFTKLYRVFKTIFGNCAHKTHGEFTVCAVMSLWRVFPNSKNVGLDSGSFCQHCHIMEYLQQREKGNINKSCS